MNHGNTNPRNPQKVDIWVERLNKKISRLLGKKGKLPPGKQTSNLAFGIIALSFTVMLWFTTGFYYLAENQFGLEMQNGKVTQVVKGIKVGFVYPYPFGDMEVIDAAVSDFIDLDKTSLKNGDFTILSLDLQAIKVDAKFNYQVTDPALVFKTSLQKQNNLDNLVAWNVQIGLHDYFADKSKNDILKSNLTVVAGEVKNSVNEKLGSLGIKVVKLNINSLSEITTVARHNQESGVADVNLLKPVALQLLQQAHEYKQNLLAQTNADIDKFNQLLPQYKANPKAITEQMYYDTLEAIPTTPLSTRYPLLKLNLSDLILLSQPSHDTRASAPLAGAPDSRGRHFGREVNRDSRQDFDDEDSGND